MSNTFNWQISRHFNYPGEVKYPDNQFVFVIDLNRCIGCQSCTAACKFSWTDTDAQKKIFWNNVETKPLGTYPYFWDSRLVNDLNEIQKLEGTSPEWERNADGSFVYLGVNIFEAAIKNYRETAQAVFGYLPKEVEYENTNIGEDSKGEDGFFFYLPRLCNHCSYPACVAACPRGAIYKREEDGIVLVDRSKCRGYKKCMEACPYKKVYFNGTTSVVEKCTGCVSIKQKTPRCFSACTGRARISGMVKLQRDGSWLKEESNLLYYLIREEKVALPLYPQFGTGPNGYYIPPVNVPIKHLTKLFGPNAPDAVMKYQKPSKNLLSILDQF